MPVKQGTSLIQSLLNLHRVDAQVRGLRSRLDNAERYLAVQERQLRELTQQLEELHSRKRQAKAKIANLEVEVGAIDERIEKYRSDLNNAATNKQYTAVLTELNTVKLQRNTLEEREIEEMERSERLDADIAGVEAQVAERTKLRDLARKQFEERQAEIGQRLSELESEREVAAGEVPSAELSLFNEIADQHDGEAMSMVNEVDRRHREYACGECNMQIPFETVSTLAGQSNTLVRCSACGRILYLQDETRGALAKK